MTFSNVLAIQKMTNKFSQENEATHLHTYKDSYPVHCKCYFIHMAPLTKYYLDVYFVNFH